MMTSAMIEDAKARRRSFVQAAQYAPDEVAVKTPNLYDAWAAGLEVAAGDKYRHGDRLYKVKEGMGHTTQADWPPDKTPAMWEVIDEGHTGTETDPIPAARGMAYAEGKYYTEAGKLYRCTRDTGTAVYYLPSELVGVYFEAVGA